MKNLKIYCVGNTETANWMRGTLCSSLEKSDVVVFPGGSDINPSIYGEQANPATIWNDALDASDTMYFNKAMSLGKKMVGICRGAQFLCAKAGGKLVQNQCNTHYHHDIFTFDGQKVWVSSSHHQAMYPWGMKSGYEVLGWARGQSAWHHGAKNTEEMVVGVAPMDMEVEAAYFGGVNSLCIQSHPEWQYNQRDNNAWHKNAIEYWRGIMDRFMAGDQFKDSKDSYVVNKEVVTA